MNTVINKYPFIFSDEKRWRIRRHFAFWLVWWLFQGFLYSFIAVKVSYGYLQRLSSSMIESLVYLIAHIFLAYFLMYFVIPRYLLRQKYAQAIGWVVFAFVAAAGISTLLAILVVPSIRSWFQLEIPNYLFNGLMVSIFLGWMAGLRGAITIGGIAAAIKLMKYWYMKEQRNLQLQQENMNARLQLLKAQIHPHFLFNTLNNIYSHTQQPAPEAANMVMELSNMLRYMLYETEDGQVRLDKEIGLLESYIRLEKARYGNGLDVQFRVSGNTKEWMIAPLLLLPLLENAFKHGASRLLQQPWISFELDLNQTGLLHLHLVNGKPEKAGDKPVAGGIGLVNVRKRLEILYGNHHSFDVVDEGEIFVVNLSITLQPAKPEQTIVSKQIPALV